MPASQSGKETQFIAAVVNVGKENRTR